MPKISGPFGNYERGTQGMICDNCSMDISADMCFAI